MMKLKNGLLGATLALAFAATAASGSMSGAAADAFAEAAPAGTCQDSLIATTLGAPTAQLPCDCWFFHAGHWYCYPCSS